MPGQSRQCGRSGHAAQRRRPRLPAQRQAQRAARGAGAGFAEPHWRVRPERGEQGRIKRVLAERAVDDDVAGSDAGVCSGLCARPGKGCASDLSRRAVFKR